MVGDLVVGLHLDLASHRIHHLLPIIILDLSLARAMALIDAQTRVEVTVFAKERDQDMPNNGTDDGLAHVLDPSRQCLRVISK